MSRTDRRALLALTLIHLLNHFDRRALAVLFPLIQEEWLLSDGQLGLIAAGYAAARAVAALPAGWLADRRGRLRVLRFSGLFWGLLALASAAASRFGTFLAARIGAGTADGANGPVDIAYLSDLFPAARRGRVIALYTLGMYIGGALGFGLAGLIGEQWGWRWAFGVPGAVGAVAALALWRLPRGAPATAAPSRVDWGAALRAMARPPLRNAFLGATLALFTSSAFSAWTPTYLHRIYGVSVSEAGVVTGLIFLGGSVAGVILGGVVSDRLLERRVDARLWTAAVFLLAATPAGAGTLLAPSRPLFAAGLFLTVLALTAYTTAITVWLQEIVPEQWRATAMALALVITQTVGGAAAGGVVGALSDLIGLRQALLIPAAAALAGGIILLAAVGGQRSAVASGGSSAGVQSD